MRKRASSDTSYFVRHTNSLAISRAVVSRLHDQNIVAIHFPGKGTEDRKSLNPDDYRDDPAGARAIRRFVELSQNGGYVWAQYYTEKTAKVGRVKPCTEVSLRYEKWEFDREYPNRCGTVAVLKTLQMIDVRTIGADKMQALRAIRPPQGTISHWPSAHLKLKAIVNRNSVPLAWCNLFPSQQEIAFSEYLREHRVAGVPTLKMLLMPPGRTLEGIDLYGVAEDGRTLFAQVTYSQIRDVQDKLDRFRRQYSGKENHLLFLARTRTATAYRDGDVWIIPTTVVEAWLQKRKQFTRRFLDEINDDELSNQPRRDNT